MRVLIYLYLLNLKKYWFVVLMFMVIFILKKRYVKIKFNYLMFILLGISMYMYFLKLRRVFL